jgi:hypothetical protein
VTTPIVIDCDPGHDDAIAILLALASPEVELIGVTTVAGNQTLDKTTRNALVTLEIAGRTDIPVAAGAEAPLRRDLRTAAHVHGETGLDGPELPEPSVLRVEAHAADFLAGLIEPGVVLVPTAPLTNVALMLERHPDVADRLERIVWMGGAIAEGNVTPAAEFNAFVDPEAAAAVFTSGIPITMVGLDVTHKALFTRAHERERDLRPPVDRHLRGRRVVAAVGDPEDRQLGREQRLGGRGVGLPLPHPAGRKHGVVAVDVDVVGRDDDGDVGLGGVEAATELLHRRVQPGVELHVPVRRDAGEDEAQGRDSIRETRSSRNRAASTSTPTSAFGSRPVTPRRSTTVRPSQKAERVSTATFARRVASSVGSSTCATAIASWIGEPSKLYARSWNAW